MTNDPYYPNIQECAERLADLCNGVKVADPAMFEAGLNWYNEAHSFCAVAASSYEVPFETVVAILAVLSPATNWEQNKLDTLAILENGESATVCTYGKNKVKALRLLWGELPVDVLGGNKVISFWHNIMWPEKAGRVTADRHAVRAALADFATKADQLVKYVYTDKRYAHMEAIYKKAAEICGLLPHQLQAICWLAVRGDDRYYDFIELANGSILAVPTGGYK